MSYPKQASVSRRLHDMAYRELLALRVRGMKVLYHQWQKTRMRLKIAISQAYSAARSGPTWTGATFKRVQPHLAAEIRSILTQYRAESMQTMKIILNHIYRQSCLRYAHMLDQLTPDNTNVAIPFKDKLHESAIAVYAGAPAATAWGARWSEWLDAYNSALVHNLAIGAINTNDVTQALDEVDSTKSNTPGYTLLDALARLYDYEASYAINAAEQQIGDLNDGSVSEEVWRTRGDLRVCDDCADNEGESVDDVGMPPMHPNCHCFTEIVPKSYAELLRSGDADDNDLADQMRQDGVVPNALVIRNDQGEIAGKTIVDFSQWIKGQGLAITAP